MEATKLERELQELEDTFTEWEKTEKERINQINQINQINSSQDIFLFMYYISLKLFVYKCENNVNRKLTMEEFFVVFFIHLQIVSFIVRCCIL